MHARYRVRGTVQDSNYSAYLLLVTGKKETREERVVSNQDAAKGEEGREFSACESGAECGVWGLSDSC